MDFDELMRAVFDGLYTYRIPIAVGTLLATLVLAALAWRRGWLAAAGRHRGRTAALAGTALVVGLPLGWYLASPLWIRTELVEPAPALVLDAADTTSSPAAAVPTTAPRITGSTAPAAT